MLLPNPHFSLMVVCSLRVMACCYDDSSIHSFDCSDYYANLCPDFDFDSSSGRCYPHTDPVVADD